MNSIASILSLTCALLLNDLMISGRIFAADSMPRVFIIDRMALTITKQRTRQNDGSLKPALAKLTREADRALISAPLSVVRKEIAPPSGDISRQARITPNTPRACSKFGSWIR